MKKKLIDLISSMQLTAILLTIIAVSTAIATFIENDYGHSSARAVVYSAFWFEFTLFLIMVNMVGSIFRYSMWKKEKWAIFIFHISFIVVIIGAGITRYFGYEGTMHIREGDTSSEFLSSETYINGTIQSGSGEKVEFHEELLMSALSAETFHISRNVDGKAVQVSFRDFYWKAGETLAPSPDGKLYLRIMTTGGSSHAGQPSEFAISSGDTHMEKGVLYAFNRPDVQSGSADTRVIHISGDRDGLSIKTDEAVVWMSMDTQQKGSYVAGKDHPFTRRMLYTAGSASFVLKEILPSAEKRVIEVERENALSGLIVDIGVDGKKKAVGLIGTSGMTGEARRVEINGVTVELSYGSRKVELPFAVKLEDFVMQRYPGSKSPSTYESYVTIIDKEKNIEKPFHIYMNHILVHRGFRFYQSSYDPDELGTILSVAKDPGKNPTYLGYFLMTLGFLIAPFTGASRFRKLAKMIDRDNMMKGVTILLGGILAGFVSLFPFSGSLQAQQQGLPPGTPTVPVEVANDFGSMLVHDEQGRVKPMDTLAAEIVNKVSRTGELYGLNHNQVFLSLLSSPEQWQKVPMVRVSMSGTKVILGMGQSEKYASFADFFDYNSRSPYKLNEEVERANRAKPAERSKLQKDIIKVDERASILFMVYQGNLIRIFPIENDPSHGWYAVPDITQYLASDRAEQVGGLWKRYLTSIRNGEYDQSAKLLEELKEYQRTASGGALPDPAVIEAEILFNHLNIFDRLTAVYLILGLLLLGLVFTRVAMPTLPIRWPMRIASGIVLAGFLLHTFGLGLRWYVSGHAPWSNGYESLIYISWATVLAGFVFARHSSFALGATSIVSGLGLFVAHLSWMDPQITTLVPVLKSYWLTIHVSVISASYGFLALGALLGFISLILFILRSASRPRLDFAITELTRINEMTLMIGVALLSIGNLLGAIWANESWGRYWSWDPKETWTLISILVYGVVLHFRFIPGMKDAFMFSTGSLLSYAAILMTYFGVNYYLTGLHSYAGGDPVPIPSFVYYGVVILGILIAIAWRKRDGKYPLQVPEETSRS